MLALAGDVAGRRILDAGCGSGPLFAALRDRGAIVTGIDKSAGMLELARRRLGDDADLRVAELGSPLPFPDGAFDDVTASLVLHYLEDWGPALAELRRVLKPGGRLIVSVDHPFAENLWHREAGLKPDYFATYNYVVEWTAGGQTALLRFWTRPLHAMTDAFTAAGFRITVISEPPPAPDRPRAAPRRHRGQAVVPVLPVLRPAGRLTAAAAPAGQHGSSRQSRQIGARQQTCDGRFREPVHTLKAAGPSSQPSRQNMMAASTCSRTRSSTSAVRTHKHRLCRNKAAVKSGKQARSLLANETTAEPEVIGAARSPNRRSLTVYMARRRHARGSSIYARPSISTEW